MANTRQRAAVGQPRLRNALELIREEVDAIGDGDGLRINLDLLAAVATARGALPKILPHRAQIVEALPAFKVTYLDRLETYALGLMQAHSLYCAAKGRLKDRSRFAAEAYELRERLLADVTVLKDRGLLAHANLAELRGPNGHLNIACDVMTLASLLRNSWTSVSDRCAVNLAELDRAEVLSDELTRAVGVRDRTPELVTNAALQRQRAYTLFICAYTEVRQAIVYVRKKTRDADKIAPSLYSKRKRADKSPETTLTDGIKGLTVNTTQSDTSATATVHSNTSADAVTVGLPGTDPFLH